MALVKWRNYGFFDKELVKNPNDDAASDVLKDINVTVCASGRGQMIFGDSDGLVYLLHRDLSVTSYRAYQCRVSHLVQLKQQNVIVSIGEDDERGHIVKIWNVEKSTKAGDPLLSRQIPLSSDTRPAKPSVIAAYEGDHHSHLAIGFLDGHVILFKDILKENRFFRGTQSQQLHQDKEIVSGVAFHSLKGGQVVLYVATSSGVYSYYISRGRRNVLDEIGCDIGHCVLSDESSNCQFVIGRNEAVHFYDVEDKGPCFGLEGGKSILHWFKSFLIIVYLDTRQRGPSGKTVHQLTIYDIRNKYVAYSAPFPDVQAVLSEWGALYVISGQDRKLFRLEEKSVNNKLEILFKKNQYEMAINLARNQRYDVDGLVDIFRQYGDHLYTKGDHDGAIKQYVKTIEHLEPSYVIRRFLDAQRIHNLTTYLEALHEKSLATTDHTTLLLNCYTKLKNVDKMDGFIKTDKGFSFDVETAIKVCRQAGDQYYDYALFLAEKNSQHDWYMRIEIEDVRNYERALAYIARLGFTDAEVNLKKYGKALVNERPGETTTLLKRLCTGAWQRFPVDRVLKAKPEEFIHIYVQKKEKLMEFLEHMIRAEPDSSPLVYNTLLELYLHREKTGKPEAPKERERRAERALELLKSPNATFNIQQALILAQMHDFRAGILHLYEKARLYRQILQYHMEQDEYQNVIATCQQHGTKEPNLWILALSYFARKEEDCKDYIADVLAHIEKRGLLPPLMVVQTLAHNSTCTLAVVKDFITRKLKEESEQIAKDQTLIKKYREDTERMRREIEQLKTSAKVFQPTKCHSCTNPIDLPAIHFLCGHSYHQGCLEVAESETECPLCVEKNREILDLIRAQEQTSSLHEEFHTELERKKTDAFSVVADYFGRGVFNKVTLLTDAPTSVSPLPAAVDLPRNIVLTTSGKF
ncbi:vacuolar protein sorting-associated protein 11 homolog [Oscarella lobularis]|uniref:vacuolar protein sorting-associated protein 11 homolog n=1 Tax=Oscarella lobularis TaxID=121494 RepID=UPI00331355CD